MRPLALAVSAAMLFSGVANAAPAQGAVRGTNEADAAFARRVLHLKADADPHVVAAAWNGTPTLFVDYDVPEGEDRPLVVLMQQADGRYRIVHVTDGEEEGGTPDFDAIGFAKADHSGKKALIVILRWGVHNSGADGSLYSVRIFQAPRSGQTDLDPMEISSHFGDGCECWHSESGGPKGDKPYTTHYRFSTIAAVKAELKRLGY